MVARLDHRRTSRTRVERAGPHDREGLRVEPAHIRELPALLLVVRDRQLLEARTPAPAKRGEPVGFRCRRGGSCHYPIEPSIWSSIRRFISTAYSIGSSRV